MMGSPQATIRLRTPTREKRIDRRIARAPRCSTTSEYTRNGPGDQPTAERILQYKYNELHEIPKCLPGLGSSTVHFLHGVVPTPCLLTIIIPRTGSTFGTLFGQSIRNDESWVCVTTIGIDIITILNRLSLCIGDLVNLWRGYVHERQETRACAATSDYPAAPFPRPFQPARCP